jgi:hypothetical protein
LKGTHFSRLAKSQEESAELEELISVEKLFIVFTLGGKPVFSS